MFNTERYSFRMLSRALLLAFGLSGFGLLAACEQEGPAEEAGEEIDETMEETGDAIEETADDFEESTD